MRTLLLALAALISAPAAAQSWLGTEQDITLKDFRFADGESLPEVKMHVTTLGQPHRNAAGEIDNAVMMLHGTGGTGHQFFRPSFADELFKPGQPLDIAKYYVILPDSIGHGKSSKPSDGLKMAFPKYDYADIVTAQHRMLTEGLGVKSLYLGDDAARICQATRAFCLQRRGNRRAQPHVAENVD
jgi:homoserine O-acetyltransferase/O-succinyltransferase